MSKGITMHYRSNLLQNHQSLFSFDNDAHRTCIT